MAKKTTFDPLLGSLKTVDKEVQRIVEERHYGGGSSLDSSDFLKVANNLSDLSDVATARTNLGLVSGGAGDIWVEKAGDTMTGLLTLEAGLKTDSVTERTVAAGIAFTATGAGELAFNAGGAEKLTIRSTGIDANNSNIAGLDEPTDPDHAATKSYVDAADATRVTGPASATDEAIARFDGVTGKLIQDGANGLLDDSGNQKLAGYLRVGSTTAPLNATAGDLTVTRVAVNDDTAFSSASGAFAKVKGELTDTSSGAKYGILAQADINNASASTSEFRALGMSGQIKSGNSNTVGTLIGLFSETRVFGNATTSNLIGYRAFGAVVPSTTELSAKTITNVICFDATGFKISGTPPNAATITTVKGVNIQNNDAPSPITITNTIGLDVAAQTRGATLNIGMRIAAPSGATSNYALQLSDTGGTAAGGITFGTDTNLYRSAASTLKTDDNIVQEGNSAHSHIMARHTTADTAGNSFTVQSGGATSGATNKSAGNLILATGLSTGSGSAQVLLQAPTNNAASTTDNTLVNRIILNGTVALTSGVAATLITIPLATLQMAGGILVYSIDASDGTDMICDSGSVYFAATNKGGVYSTNSSLIGTDATVKTDVTDTITPVFSFNNGTNQTQLQLTCTLTGITATIFRVTYQIISGAYQSITAP